MDCVELKIPLAFVTFGPNEYFYDRLDRILVAKQPVYIFCNCDSSFKTLEAKYKDFSNLKYIYLGSNVGLSAAYNSMLNLIEADGFTHFFLFDQDTLITDHFFAVKDSIPALVDLSAHVLTQLEARGIKGNIDQVKLSSPMFVINSGSLVNIGLVRALGGYPSSYFVEGVDYYLCLMASIHNLKIGYLHGNFGLDHTVDQGDLSIKLFNLSFLVRFYGWNRIKDVTKSSTKLICLSLVNLKIRYFLRLLQFLFVFYLRNIFGILLRQ